MPSKAKKCKHCKAFRRTQGRGLCVACYDNPSIRKFYPRLEVQQHGDKTYANTNVEHAQTGNNKAGSLPQHPTQARPGSGEKICVMIERLDNKHTLHHPKDRRLLFGMDHDEES